jgi:hypothetical protein
MFSQVLEDIKKKGKGWNAIKKKGILKKETGGFLSNNPYKKETISEGKEGRKKFMLACTAVFLQPISNIYNEIYNSVQVNIFPADYLCEQQICICNKCILRLMRDAKQQRTYLETSFLPIYV